MNEFELMEVVVLAAIVIVISGAALLITSLALFLVGGL